MAAKRAKPRIDQAAGLVSPPAAAFQMKKQARGPCPVHATEGGLHAVWALAAGLKKQARARGREGTR